MPTPRWRARPTGLRRLIFRAPIMLYHARLGWLLGHRFVMITHRGRRSGLTRRVVVEVTTRDRRTGSVVVASGFGPSAQWYRNLRACPEATMQIGRRSVAVRAVPLAAEEGAEVMAGYARRQTTAARVLARYMGMPVDGSEESFRELGRVLPFLRLEPVDR